MNFPMYFCEANDYLKRSVETIQNNDTTLKKATRVAMASLDLAGALVGSLGLIEMGVAMIEAPARTGFFASCLLGARVLSPFMLVSCSCFALSALGSIYAGKVIRPIR